MSRLSARRVRHWVLACSITMLHVGVWVDGKRLPAARPIRQTVPNADQFATAIAPQGTGEFDELWVATCAP